MNIDGIFNNLRQKLDVLGYTQPLPLSALSLVSSIFEDLVRTTESLRDAKKKISQLLEEKSCWELGVEPYKCDNSRLLNECNQLNVDLIKKKEKFEETLCDYAKKIRNLETDKHYLEEHCAELESQVRELAIKYSDTKVLKNKNDGTNMIKRPAFVTTVRSGVFLPNPTSNQHDQRKCTKCNSILFRRLVIDSSPREHPYGPPKPHEIEKLQNYLKDRSDDVTLFKKKVEARDREIRRLNELLQGGRPTTALARDCCYKNIGPLTEDLELLQREKIEVQTKLTECESDMHEAKQRALDLVEQNKKLETELEELRSTALSFEKAANEEINEKEREIENLHADIQKLKVIASQQNYFEDSNLLTYNDAMTGARNCNLDERRKLHERLNELTAREREMSYEIERMQKKNEKLKYKLITMQKGSEDRSECNRKFIEDERARLKSERDFFQKEYLNVIHKAGSEKELDFLQMQIKLKDEELRNLRAELTGLRHHQPNPANSQYLHQQRYHEHPHTHPPNHHSHLDRQFPPRPCSSSTTASNHYPNSVIAAVLRSERERDVAKSELERIKLERETLRERLQSITETQYKESQRLKEEIDELKNKILCLEREKREMETAKIPGQTHIVLMKEEIEELKKRIFELQSENCKLKTSYNQIKILHDQTETVFVELQNKYAIAETQLENAETRLSAFDTNRTSARNELDSMRNEIIALKSITSTIENEKDKIIAELDCKTEKIYKLESEIKSISRKKKDLETTSQEFQEKYE